MSLQRVPIKDFRGGLNTRDGPFDLTANESPDLLNVTISSLVGQLQVRKGKTRIDTAGLPNSVETCDYMKQVVLANGIRHLMLSINGSIFYMNPAGAVAELFKGTPGTVWDFEQFSDQAFQDWVYCGNGVDAMQKWDGIAAATVAWPAGKGTIPKGGVLCVWENRMFISYVTANVQRVYFSEFGDPQATLEEYGFIDVRGPEDDLDAVQDLAVLGGRLFVMKRRSVFALTSAVTMANRRVGSPGVWGRFQTTEMEDKLYFFNPQGVWSTGGVQVSMESGQINNYFPKELNQAQYAKARLVATKDTYPRLLLAVTTGINTENDKLIEMIPHINFRRIGGRRYLLLPAFMLHTLASTSLATWNPTGAEELVVGSSLTTVGAGSGFPVLGVTDPFNRSGEKPLTDAGKWSAWAWATSTGLISSAPAWNNPDAVAVDGARWNVGEFTRTAAEIAVNAEATGQQAAAKEATEAANAGGGGAPWETPGGVLVPEGNARVGMGVGSSQVLSLKKPGFAIPAGVTIKGIEVSIPWNTGFKPGTLTAQMYKAGVLAGSTHATTITGTVVFGGPIDMWGTTWTPAQINAANFGVGLEVTNPEGFTLYHILNPVVIRVYYTEPEPDVAVHACYAAGVRSGYTARATLVGGERQITLEKWEAGVKTVLGTKNLPLGEGNYRLGITVIEGKVRAWINKAEKGWELVLEVADAKYNKGYAGFEAEGLTWAVTNFRVAEPALSKGRLYKLFNGTTDEGAEIEARWQSSWMAVQGEEPKERLRRLNTELFGDAIVDVFTDFENAYKYTKEIPKTNPEGGGGGEYRFTRVRPETRGRFHSVRFRSKPGGTPFLINAAEMVIRGGKEH